MFKKNIATGRKIYRMIKVQNVHKSYGTGENNNEILKGISLTIERGDFVVILGASGSGKSTLLNVISGLEAADAGSILYSEEDCSSADCLKETQSGYHEESYINKNISEMDEREATLFRKEMIGYVFQQYFLLPNLNVDKNVKMGADLAGNADYRELIKAVGLADKMKKYPYELSGGEQQRASIARALAKKPKVLYLDEPTGALDEATGRSVLELLCRLQKEMGFTMVMVTHNQNIAEMANTVVSMNSGRIVAERHNDNPKSAYEIAW